MPYRSKIYLKTNAATHGKRLSICLLPNGFSFSEVSDTNELVGFGEAEGIHASVMTDAVADVKSFFAEVGIQALGYKALELVVMSDESVWVPDEMYLVGANRNYLGIVGAKATGVMTCHSDYLASTAVFTASDVVATAFKIGLPGLAVKHQFAKMASSDVAAKSLGHPLMLIHWRGRMLDVAVYKDNRYLFGNSLPYDSNSSALYQVVEVMKTFGIDGPNSELLLCGNVDRENYALVSPYFPRVSLYTGNVFVDNKQFAGLHTYRHALLLMR